MLTTNPFAALNDYVSPLVLQAYLVLMVLGVAARNAVRRVSQGQRQVLRPAKGKVTRCRHKAG